MIDFRDRSAMATRIAAAWDELEYNRPVPDSVRATLDDVLAALRDSGPAQLHMRAHDWSTAIDLAEKALVHADEDPSVTSMKCLLWSIGSLEQRIRDVPRSGSAIREDDLASLGIGRVLLLASSRDLPPSLRSRWRRLLRGYVPPAIVATQWGVRIVEPTDWSSRRGGPSPWIVHEVPYVALRNVWIRQAGDSAAVLTLVGGGADVTITLAKSDATALVQILEHRTGLTASPPPAQPDQRVQELIDRFGIPETAPKFGVGATDGTIDVRDRRAVARRLRAVRRGLRRRADADETVRLTLLSYVDALMESGPFEYGGRWFEDRKRAERAATRVFSDRGSARRAIRRLEVSIRRPLWASLWPAFALLLLGAVFIGFPAAWIATDRHHVRVALGWALFYLPFAWWFVIAHTYGACGQCAVRSLALDERCLLAAATSRADDRVRSRARGLLGLYVRPVLIVTDRRLILAEPVEAGVSRRHARYDVGWEIPFSRLRFAEIVSPTVTFGTADGVHELRINGTQACSAILTRHAPEAIALAVDRLERRGTRPASAGLERQST